MYTYSFTEHIVWSTEIYVPGIALGTGKAAKNKTKCYRYGDILKRRKNSNLLILYSTSNSVGCYGVK